MSAEDQYNHDYTPKTFSETANTLSCHQMGGLVQRNDASIVPVDMGVFQAKHLLEAGYILVYDPDSAAGLIESGKRVGYAL